MAFSGSNNNLSYGLNSPLNSVPSQPVVANRAPVSGDVGSIGQLWLYSGSFYIYTGTAGWIQVSPQGGAGLFSSLAVSGVTILGGALTVNSGTSAINIGTDAVAKTVTIGNVTGATGLVLNSGTGGIALASTSTGDITVTSADTVLIDAAGVLELNSSGGIISIGNDAVAQNINVGTGAAARTITVGNATSTTGIAVNSGTGGITLNANATGKISLVGAPVSASATFTVVNNSLVGKSTLIGNTLAQNATQALTLTNSLITATNSVIYSVTSNDVSGNGAALTVISAVQAAGSMIITVKNVGGASGLGATDSIMISHMILG